MNVEQALLQEIEESKRWLAKEYSLDKQQTSYDDLLDALRLSLNGYYIK